jgi:hypothetical protein
MQRARRLAAVVTVALVGSLVLTGCQSNPTVAAYVGKTEITEKQVSAVVDDFNQKNATAAAASPAPDQPQEQKPEPLSRVDALTAMVLQEGCAQLAREKGFRPASTTTAEDYAKSRGIPATSQYAAIFAELITCASGVPQATVAPTEAELRALYDRAVAAGMLQQPVPSFEQIKAQLAQDQGVQQAFATKALYNTIASDERVVVNPRYRPLTVEAFQGGLLPVVIGGAASEAVVDRPAPANAAS